MNELVVLPAEIEQIVKDVSIEKRNEVQLVLNHVFNGVAKMRDQLDLVVVVDENNKVSMKIANNIRLGVRQVRLDGEKEFDLKREELRIKMLSDKTEDSLWLKSKQVMQILTKEIEETAKWKETTKERIDAERKELKLHERIMKVLKFNPEIMSNEFENMGDEAFSIFLSGIEKSHNDRIEAEQKAEAEKLRLIEEDKKERERINQENERLRKEAEIKARELQAEREKIRKENEEKERLLEIERKKQADELAKQKAESDKKQREIENAARIERKNQDEIIRVQRAKQAIIERQLQAQKDTEAKRQQAEKQHLIDEAAAKAKSAKAPDKEMLTKWIESFNIECPEFVSLSVIVIASDITGKFESFKKWANQQIERL